MNRAAETFLALTKFRIAALSTSSGAAGWVAFARAVRPEFVGAMAGLLVTALGACALNEWQDREIDARMERTRRRPIPSGRISPRAALAVASGLIALGLATLAAFGGLAAAALGASAVLWYDGVYAYLKRVSPFAAIPGALVGAIPPAIGWTAAGGSLADPGAWGLAFFFFLWQVPHFWLLLLAFARDYEASGLPSLVERLGEDTLVRLTFTWSLFAAGSSLLLRVFGVVASPEGAILLLLAGAAFAAGSLGALRPRGGEASFRRAFSRANAYAAAVLAIVVLDALAVF